MAIQLVLDRYLGTLLAGDRPACRAVIEETLQRGMTANNVYMDVIWPIMAEIDKLYRQDRINAAQEAFATRINRTIVDQLQNKLPRKATKDKKVIVCSGATEQAEQGGQMMTDLFESDGWEGRFLGGKVNNDDILAFVNSYRPDVLLLFGVAASDAPRVRQLIDKVKSINACPEMKIMLSGGVFGRTEGLWEEIGADMYADTASESVRIASANDETLQKPQRTIKRRKKTRAV